MSSAPGEAVKRIADLIYARSSICFSAGRAVNLDGRMRERRGELGLEPEAYADLLGRDHDELDLLIERVSTKETHFFRIPEQFCTLRELVLPKLEEELLDRVYAGMARGMVERQPLRIWSAGCSTGPEPYSVAIALLASLKHPRAWRLELLATDLSAPALAEARRGRYRVDSLREVPPDLRQRYFAKSNGEFEVDPQVRELVDFRVFNLRELLDRGPGPHSVAAIDGARETRHLCDLDLVLCRNVMIYFDFAAQQAMVDRLYECLRPGGWLFTGDAELLHVYRHQFETVEAFGTCVYRKPGGEP